LRILLKFDVYGGHYWPEKEKKIGKKVL
jgi:hypothetical protein